MSENPIIQILGGNYDPLTGRLEFENGQVIIIKPDGIDAITGPSAYDLALQNRYAGTLTQWLESLHGADAAPPNITIGEITTVATTEPASATITGAYPDFVLSLVVPKGETGAAFIKTTAAAYNPATAQAGIPYYVVD